MNMYELKLATQNQLRDTRLAMLDMDYLLALEKLPAAEKRQAALRLSNVQLAYLKMRKAKLSSINEELKENEPDLLKGIKSLDKALKDLKKAKKVLDAAGSLLSIVGRIVSLI